MYRLPMKDSMTFEGDLPGIHSAGSDGRPAEGGFIYRPEGSEWVYFFFSDGITPLGGATSLPEPGKEYKVRVGRAKTVDGPFVSDLSNELTENIPDAPTGFLVLGSHDNIYAPGGQAIFRDPVSGMDVMAYHYVKKDEPIGGPSYLGINYLSFESGWPVVMLVPQYSLLMYSCADIHLATTHHRSPLPRSQYPSQSPHQCQSRCQPLPVHVPRVVVTSVGSRYIKERLGIQYYFSSYFLCPVTSLLNFNGYVAGQITAFAGYASTPPKHSCFSSSHLMMSV